MNTLTPIPGPPETHPFGRYLALVVNGCVSAEDAREKARKDFAFRYSIRRDVILATLEESKEIDSLNLSAITPHEFHERAGRVNFKTALLLPEEKEFMVILHNITP